MRISDSLENAGNRDLSFLDVTPPVSSVFAVTHLTVRVAGGEERILAADANSAPAVSVHFDPPWPQRQARDIVFDYDVASVPGTSLSAAGADGFYLCDPKAFLEWSPLPGPFSKGELRALDERLHVTVPADWLVLAPGADRRKALAGGLVRHEFGIGGDNVATFVIAGRFQELRVQISSRTVVFWTLNPLDGAVAKAEADLIANAAVADEDVFGPLPGNERMIRVIEAPGEMPSKSDGIVGARAFSFPGGVLLNREAFAQGLGNDRVMAITEAELVRSWLGWRVYPRPDSQLARGAARFAELLAAEASNGGAARQSLVEETIAAYDHDSSSSASPRVLQAERAALFLIALQDLAGKEKFAGAMHHIMLAMAGQEVDDEELRAALEEETGRDLAGTFRTWLGDRGLPPDFRGRYAVKQ